MKSISVDNAVLLRDPRLVELERWKNPGNMVLEPELGISVLKTRVFWPLLN